MATSARGGGRRRGELALRLTDASELRISFAVALRPRRRSRRGRRGPALWSRSAFFVLQVVAYAAVLFVVVAIALTVSARGQEPPYGARAFSAHTGAARAIAAPRSPLTVASEPPFVVREHLVGLGEDLLSVAAQYGVTPQTIAINNGIDDSAEVRPGTLLRVPTADVALYTVQRGDTVESIAARFGLPAEVVRERNRLYFEPENASPGSVIVLPAADGGYATHRLHISEPPRVFQLPRGGTAGRGLIQLPVNGFVTQRYHFYHRGVDIAAPYGSPIRSADAGTVTSRGVVPVGGLHVCVRHDWGLETCYYHASEVAVEVGQRVAAGQRIAAIGMTGTTTGPHVHWEARTHGALVDPLAY
ncbi:MAG: peptidoglycan DD-metalloendopeptidase family protein [Candidatus Limnocylindria bacterium]